MGFSGAVFTGLFILGILFELVTKGVPTAAGAVATWWDDTTTIILEHDWKYTDAVLYLGIVVILVLRYTKALKMLGLSDGPCEGTPKKKNIEKGVLSEEYNITH